MSGLVAVYLVSPDRRRAAAAEANRLAGFSRALHLDPAQVDSIVVYLTHLLETEDPTTLHLDKRIGLLEVARRLDGLRPLREDRGFVRFRRGLMRTARPHLAGQQSDPLYRELLVALVEQAMRPTPKQVRLRTAVLLLHHTGWPALAIARLTWHDLDLRRPDRTTIHWPHQLGDPSRPPLLLEHARSTSHPLREALDHARDLPDPFPYVTWPPKDYKPREPPFLVTKARRALEHTDGAVDQALELVSRSPEQIRDRAALVLGYGAALTTREALALTRDHITLTSDGLLVAVPGRRASHGIRREPGALHDPIAAWETWTAEVATWGITADHGPPEALLEAHHCGLRPHGIGEHGLNALVRRPAQALGLKGTFSWQSLRWGAIRTAIRDNERTHHLASLAGTNPDAIGVHQRREQLLTHSVAGQLGL